MHHKVLIVCFTFPPFPGIGGRRWAKFAKYLHRKQNDVFVIAALKQLTQKSAWASDATAYADQIKFIPSRYPQALTGNPKTIWQKIRYRLALYAVRLFAKGNYYDQSSFWENQIKKAVEDKIREGYNNVIVSCGPFKMAAFLIELKHTYPEVRFIVDFRDPWTNNKTSFGYTSISPARLVYEREMEKKVIQNYDYIFSVSDQMNTYFKSLVPGRSDDRFITIINGFDTDDYPKKCYSEKYAGKLRCIFTGTLYDKSMHIFNEFCDVLRKLQIEHPSVYNLLIFDFYGHVPNVFKDITKDLEIIAFRGEIAKEDVYTQIADSHVAMLFLTDDMNYTFSTKFYEYVSQEIPIAVFANEGHTGTFIENNGLGYACFSGQIEQALLKIADDWQNKKLQFNSGFDVSAYSIDGLTESVITYLV